MSSNDKMIEGCRIEKDVDGCGRDLSQHLAGGAGENHQNTLSQDNQSPNRDSKGTPPEYKSTALPLTAQKI
jgi:hypothetical protein